MKGHKWFAAIYDRMSAPEERRFMGEVRAELAGGARGKILEIGAGTGLNFPHYRDGAEVIATEPDPYMRQRAQRRLMEAGKHIELRKASAEELPFESDSFDTVVGTLVMCSVPHPQRALAEIRRVLKPGGEYRFYEHVPHLWGFSTLDDMSVTKALSVPSGRTPYCRSGAGSPRAATRTGIRSRR